jgi:hypothetical protein
MGNASRRQSRLSGTTPSQVADDSDVFFRKGCSESIAIPSSTVATTTECKSFVLVAQCLSPLLAEIGSFLADRPKDIVPLFVLSARWLAEEATLCMDDLWEQMYFARWPAFYDAFSFNVVDDWRSVYEDMIYSRCSCQLEVFEREKKVGFDMAAMPAIVTYEGGTDTYAAKYISASEVNAEIIPCTENYRLRFCPISARQQLQPFFCHIGVGRPQEQFDSRANAEGGSTWLRTLSRLMGKPSADGGARTARDDLPLHTSDLDQVTCLARQTGSGLQPSLEVDRTGYPYKVLHGFEGLVVGQNVELQWKMQELSPFGWWFGQLESLQRGPNSKTAIATITFAHFPEHSSWHRLRVRFGDAKVRSCSFGGFSGGIRPVSTAEKDRWMKFLPQSAQHVAEMQHRLLRSP